MGLNHPERIGSPAPRVAAGADRAARHGKQEVAVDAAVLLVPEKHPFLRKILHQRMAALERFAEEDRSGQTVLQLLQKGNASGEILFEHQKAAAVFQIGADFLRLLPDGIPGDGIRPDDQKIA